MKFYMSYWHTNRSSKFLGENKGFLDEAKEFYKLSAFLIKKNHGNINLITDFEGKKHLENIFDWDSIDLSLEKLPKEYSKVWSLGKLKSIQVLAQRQEPFLHVDHDVFIINKLPESLLKENIILQSYDNFYLGGALKHFFNIHCKKKYLISNCDAGEHYNCGIIGGNNFTFFSQYSTSSIKMVLDKENESFWLDNNEKDFLFEYFSKALLAEQYYISALLKKNNIKPSLLLNRRYRTNYIDIANGYVHLYGDRKRKFMNIFHELKDKYKI